MKNNELKPCPFCGCDGAGTQWHHGYWSVTCGYHHDETPSGHCFQDWGEFKTEEEAVKAWNRRKEESAIQMCITCRWSGKWGACENPESKFKGYLMRPADGCEMWKVVEQ